MFILPKCENDYYYILKEIWRYKHVLRYANCSLRMTQSRSGMVTNTVSFQTNHWMFLKFIKLNLNKIGKANTIFQYNIKYYNRQSL